MLIAEKIIQKQFKAKTMKQAYLECCKWIATNILAENNSKNLSYSIKKNESSGIGCVDLEVYIFTDESEVFEHNCDICREFAGAFFNKENKYRCEVCKTPPYRKRLETKLETLKTGMGDFMKGLKKL